MARDLVSIVKRSRREKVALHPKAIKPMARRAYGPGDHGATGTRSKPSQFAIQLREKQKVKRIYGLLEKQFARLIKEATAGTGVAGENLLRLLELRMDNAIYRLGFAPSRQSARQLVTHGHIMLNGRRVDIPSIRLKPGDVLTVRPKSASNAYFKALSETLVSNQPTSGWLSLNASKMEAKVTGLPSREEVDADIQEQLIIEFYSR